MKNIISILVLIATFFVTYNINFGTYKEYHKHYDVEFKIVKKIKNYNGVLGFICKLKTNKYYYIPVNEFQYYNNVEGDNIILNISQYELDNYNNINKPIDTYKNIVLTLLFIFLFTTTIIRIMILIYNQYNFDSEQLIYFINTIYIICTIINFSYINLLC